MIWSHQLSIIVGKIFSQKYPDVLFDNNTALTDITKLAHSVGGGGYDDLSFADIELLAWAKIKLYTSLSGLSITENSP